MGIGPPGLFERLFQAALLSGFLELQQTDPGRESARLFVEAFQEFLQLFEPAKVQQAASQMVSDLQSVLGGRSERSLVDRNRVLALAALFQGPGEGQEGSEKGRPAGAT